MLLYLGIGCLFYISYMLYYRKLHYKPNDLEKLISFLGCLTLWSVVVIFFLNYHFERKLQQWKILN